MQSFKIVHSQAVFFKNLVNSIKDKVDVADVLFDKGGMKLTTIDTSSVCLVNCRLDNGLFKDYECSTGEIQLSLSLTDFHKVMQCANANDQVTLFYSSNASDQLSIRFDGSTPSYFNLSLMERGHNQTIDLPDGIQYDYQELLPCSDFARYCKNLAQFSDDVTIERNSRGLTFTSVGDAIKDANYDHRLSSLFRSPYKGIFSLKYLESFTKASTLSDTVILKLIQDQPLVVEYVIGGGSILQFMLAPKTLD